MVEVRWREDLAESKAEIARLGKHMATVMPTVHEDLSVVSLVPKWSGAETAAPLEELVSSIKGTARIGQWDDADRLQVAVLRLLDPVKVFYKARLELHAEDTTWE
jgi:hypothetical protein